MRSNRQQQANIFIVLVALAASVGCSTIKEDAKPDPSMATSIVGEGTSERAYQPGDYDTGGWSCPEKTSGSQMVLIPMPDGEPYCIDARPATYGEYGQFVKEKGDDFSGQPEKCEHNNDYGPVEYYDRMGCFPLVCGPSLANANPDWAVGCLDFCDAWAYCAWAGKRLCGVRGAESGKVMVVDAPDVESVGRAMDELRRSVRNEWYNVCSQGGTTKYPYGDTRKAGTCIDNAVIEARGTNAAMIRDTSQSACRGTHPPYDRVYHMSGNANAWINICSPSGDCAAPGGPVGKDDSCAGSFGTFSDLGPGVRCCADAVPGNDHSL